MCSLLLYGTQANENMDAVVKNWCWLLRGKWLSAFMMK